MDIGVSGGRVGGTKAFFVALVLAVGLAVLGTTPPRPAPVSAPADRFSAGRAMADVRLIAQDPHSTGTPRHRWVRERLEQRLIELGLGVRQDVGEVTSAQTREWLNRYNGTKLARIPLVNLVAVLPGADPKLPAIALMAHYDGVPGSPAAADDGAGVASILETLRVLAADRTRRRDVIVIFTDGEESGLLGAKMFFGDGQAPAAPEARRIGAIINLEARGGGGKANLFQTSAQNGDAARLWASTAPNPAGTSLATFIYSVLPNDTDLSMALRGGLPAGTPAWNFAFIGRPQLYHSPLATPERLDQGSLQQMGEQTLALARALSRSEALPGPAPDIVFFDVFGLFVVHYAVWWGWAMLAAAFAGYAAQAARNFEPRALLGGAARMLGLVVVAGGTLYLLNLLSGADGPADYYDRLAAISRLQAMALCASLAAALLLVGRKPDTPSGEVGLAIPLWLAAAAFQALAPVAAYVLTVPLLLGGVAAVARVLGRGGMVMGIVVAGIVGGYALMLGFALMQAVGPMVPMVAVLPLAIICAIFAPLRPGAGLGRWIAAGLMLAAVAIALWVRLDPPADSIPIYSEARSLGAKG
jgi:hypothetical protein